jgi:Dynein heavy chain, N-terminal region 1
MILLNLRTGCMDGSEKASEAVSTDELATYIDTVCCALLAVDSADSGLKDVLLSAEAVQLLTAFAADVQTSALFIEQESDDSMSSFKLSAEVRATEDNAAVAIIKRVPGALEPSTSLARQLQVITFPGRRSSNSSAAAGASPNDQTVLSALQLYTRHVFAPAVAQHSADSVSQGDSKSEASSAALQRRVRELDLALAHCQKRLDIPAVALTAPASVAAAAAAVAAGASINLDELGLAARAQDDAFLNELQAVVNGWVKEVQRVTRLTDTPFPDTAVEELSFWRELASALHTAQDQLDSPSVQVKKQLLSAVIVTLIGSHLLMLHDMCGCHCVRQC